MDTIDIVTAADAAYVPHVGAMLHSLFERNPQERFAVHFLHRPRLSGDLLQKLAAVCDRHGARFASTEVPHDWLAGFPVDDRYPEEAWYRVILPRLLPELSRVLWLDADTITLQPIRALWETPLRGLPLAASPNAMLYAFVAGVAKMGIPQFRDRYFNTGVLLLDLALMRAEDSELALRGAAARYRPWIKFADQDVLNCVYHDRYVRLHAAWNWMTHHYINVPEVVRVFGRKEYREARGAPRILHFTGAAPIKPWSFRCAHPYRDYYLRHRAAAGFAPPEVAPQRWTHHVVRRLPLRLHAVLNALRRRQYGEMLSYVRPW